MYIGSPEFAHKKVFLDNRSNGYSPKKRWDQGVFGSQRKLLLSHVENALKQHQNDGDILEKFRKQAQQLKISKRKQKFPHLFPTSSLQKFLPATQRKSKLQSSSRLDMNPLQQQLKLRTPSQPQLISIVPRAQQKPQLIYAINSSPNYMLELQARLQYERAIAQKDLQLYKRQEKIKKQRRQIARLNQRISKKEKQEELQKYMRSQQQMKKINKMLVQMKSELITGHENLSAISNSPVTKQQRVKSNKRNKSELVLSSRQGRLSMMSNLKQEQDKNVESNISIKLQNPQLVYSPQVIKNRSSVFDKVKLFSPLLLKSQVRDHLEELRNYNKRLEYFHGKNREKLTKLTY